MSSSAAVTASATTTIYVGMDVHKDSVTIAVLPAGAPSPTRLERLPNDVVKLKRFLDRLARDGAVRACYEASGAGYVLERAMHDWGHACEVIGPSLIPKRPGAQRKHDKRDAADLAVQTGLIGNMVFRALGAQQRRFTAFRAEYNDERPHAALGGDPPARRYAASPRPYPAALPPLEYPGHFLVKRVTNAGTIRFKHELLFLADALKQHRVGLEETGDGVRSLYLGAVLLGRIDEREMKVYG